MNLENIKEELNKIEDQLIDIRRELHENPELSHEEFETSKRIQNLLSKEQIPFTTGYATTGVLGVIKGNHPGKTVALRADIDALPILEKNDHSFVSKTDNKMHACGHDAHTAMLIGTGILLNKYKHELEGTVLLVFQPAEEDAPRGGSSKMMEDGVFDKYKPDAIYAQHVWPDLPVGQIGVRPGAMMGNSDRFTITIKGSSGHASMPHQTNDAIIAANQVITGLQTLVSRNTDPLESAVVTIGKIQGGTRYNVIAEEVTLEGTVRTYKNDVKTMIKQKMSEIAEGIATSMGATAEVKYLDGYPATMNSERWASLVKSTAQQTLGEEATPDIQPSMGGEDFGKFLLKYPGAYYWLGTAIPSRTVQRPLHDPEFDIDERALKIGVECMTHVTINTLQSLKEKGD
ncbi:carboxypeptidase [Salipaludibacillus keqinensis]|uniref:Carboxypeptidase n=1 Tax=Salipaludibacillus keqinensis TaxID=2045207 RepID=A0A323TB85_9BACI|nr:M20 family metallopeptidase [Salipaludibacillus keqinensis]PYZ92702.1 carboxypeptidase [Salipaludibacillus keqinensis]